MEPTIEDIEAFSDLMKVNNAHYLTKGIIYGAITAGTCYYIGYGGASLYYFVKTKKAKRLLKKHQETLHIIK